MTAKMHRVHMPKVGEGIIYVPGGTPYEVDDYEKYTLGSYMRLGNKGFVYVEAGGTLVPDVGAKQANNQKIGNRAIAADADIGTLVITFSSNVSLSANQLKGGEIIVFPTGNKAFTRRIVSHPAVTATADLEVTVDSPIPVALTDEAGSVECILDPYKGVTQDSNEWTPVLGMPVMEAEDGEFLWLQVEGISWCAPEAAVGAAVNALEVCFGGDGALQLRDSNNLGNQRAGMVVAPNTAGSGQGAPFIMLNIDH